MNDETQQTKHRVRYEEDSSVVLVSGFYQPNEFLSNFRYNKEYKMIYTKYKKEREEIISFLKKGNRNKV